MNSPTPLSYLSSPTASPGNPSTASPDPSAKSTATTDPVSLIALSQNGYDLSRFIGPGMLAAAATTELSLSRNLETMLEPIVKGSILARPSSTPQNQNEKGVLILTLAASLHSGSDETQQERLNSIKLHYEKTIARALHDAIPTKPETEPTITNPHSNKTTIELDILPIHDLTSTPFPREESARRVSGFSPSIILLAKITGAAAEMGYGLEEVRRVAGLVERNVATVFSSITGTGTLASSTGLHDGTEKEKEGEGNGKERTSEGAVRDNDGPREQVEEMLSRLLLPHAESHGHGDQERGRAALRVNSNEPVLLLNTSPSSPPWTKPHIHRVLSHTLTHLQAAYNIKPVRVYAGSYLPIPVYNSDPDSDSLRAKGEDANHSHNKHEDEMSKRGFSISLLNVVNSELGGPGMVALLDHRPARGGVLGWEGAGLVTKEEWEGEGAGLLELAIRNWEGVGAGERGERGEDERGENIGHGGLGVDGKDTGKVGGGDMVSSPRNEELQMKAEEGGHPAESTDEKFSNQVARAPEQSIDPEATLQEEEDKDSAAAPRQPDSLELDAKASELHITDRAEEAERDVVESGGKGDIGDGDGEEEESDGETDMDERGTSTPASKTASEDLEMVERERERIMIDRYGFWS